jgi:ComF family protein
MQVYDWLKKLPSFVYPPHCLLCGAAGDRDRDLCADCAADLPHNHHACARCALPLPPGSPVEAHCGACSRKRPAFDRCYAALLYDDNTGFLISRLKFHHKLNHARLLSQLLIDYLERHQAPRPDLILPVPLHRQRLRERGYNQALEIARPIGRHFGVPIEPRLCRRVHPTPAQTGLDRKTRRRNLRRAFQLTGDVAGQTIALLDDVVTTGSTVTELAKVLKRSGAARVDVWAVARTSEDRR